MPLHYHDFITPKSSGNAAIGKAVALGFFFPLVALGDDFFAQANTVGLEVEERALRHGEDFHRTHVTFRQAGIDLVAHIVQGVAIFELDVQVRQEATLVLIIRHDNKELAMKYLSEMTDEQTLVMYSGHPMGLFPSHKDAPRVIV